MDEGWTLQSVCRNPLCILAPVISTAIALSTLAPSAEGPPVFLSAGTLTSSLAAELEAEGYAVTSSREDATTWVWARAGEGALELQVVTAQGRLLVERKLSTSSGLGPALRTSALLVEEALSADVAAGGAARTWTLSAAARLGAWASPATPATGLSVAAHVPVGPLDAGLRVSVDGLGCCAISRPGVLAASSAVASIAVDVSKALLDVGPITLAGTAALGVGARRIRSTVESFADAGQSEVTTSVEGLARAGISAHLRAPVDGLALTMAVGAEAHVARVRVAVPEPYAGSEEALDPGMITPWAELGLALSFF